MQAHQLPASNGKKWFSKAIKLFGKRPVFLLLLCFLIQYISILFATLGQAGLFISLAITPLLTLIFLRSCQVIDQQTSFTIKEIIRPILAQNSIRQLLFVGLIYAILMFLVLQLLESAIAEILASQAPTKQTVNAQEFINIIKIDSSMMQRLLLPLCASFLINLIFWFVPALIGLGRVEFKRSLLFSLLGVWRNIMAFIVLLLTLAVFAFVISFITLLLASAGIPFEFMQLLLIAFLLSIVYCVMYTSYEEVFST